MYNTLINKRWGHISVEEENIIYPCLVPANRPRIQIDPSIWHKTVRAINFSVLLNPVRVESCTSFRERDLTIWLIWIVCGAPRSLE